MCSKNEDQARREREAVEVADEAAARSLMWERMDSEENVDNYRFAFKDDPAQMEEYFKRQYDGCCGFYEKVVRIDGRLALIGCNYGH